jgi:hypothetical protein
MRLFRPSQGRPRYAAAEVEWAAALREGHSDEDDPRAHKGVIQHAYSIGEEAHAICGYTPPLRAMPDGTKRPALALPTDRYNPRCRRCTQLIWSARSEDNIAAERVGLSEVGAKEGAAPPAKRKPPSPEGVARRARSRQVGPGKAGRSSK